MPLGRTSRRPIAGAVALIALGAAALLVWAPPWPSAGPIAPRFLEALRLVAYDYEPVRSPRALASQADIVVHGRFASVADGRVLLPAPDRPVGTAVFAVEVIEVLAGDRAILTDEHIYFEVPRARGITVEMLNDSLPSGEVVLFLTDRAGRTSVNSAAGRPASAGIYGPLPQGFWMLLAPPQ